MIELKQIKVKWDLRELADAIGQKVDTKVTRIIINRNELKFNIFIAAVQLFNPLNIIEEKRWCWCWWWCPVGGGCFQQLIMN